MRRSLLVSFMVAVVTAILHAFGLFMFDLRLNWGSYIAAVMTGYFAAIVIEK